VGAQLEPQFRNGKGLIYKSRCKTRFGTRFFQMERATKNNIAALAVVTDPEYMKRYEDQVVQARPVESDDDDLVDDDHAPDPANRTVSEILEENKSYVTNPSFWRDANTALRELEPVIQLLKLADSDRLMVGKIYAKMLAVHEGLLALEERDAKYKGIADLWYKRWQRQHHAVYCVAHVLHPDHNQSNPLSDPYVAKEVKQVLKSSFADEAERTSVHAAILRYLDRRGCFSTYEPNGDRREVWSEAFLTTLSPWQWWCTFVADEPLLAKFAMRVLQIGISSSACERVFSKWTYVVTKYRTRLSLTRQMKAVYCYQNWRLLESSQDDKWYRSDSEDEEVELVDN
jgi:hypothetical protein